MERDLWIRPVAGATGAVGPPLVNLVAGTGSGTGHPAPARRRPAINASLSRTARILLDRHPIPKYTFAPLTAGEIVVATTRSRLSSPPHSSWLQSTYIPDLYFIPFHGINDSKNP